MAKQESKEAELPKTVKNNIIEHDWQRITKDARPSMVFSIFGNSDSFVPKPWPRSVFQAALIDSARNAGASMILYKKGDYEVSKVIENAYSEYKCILQCDVQNTKKDEVPKTVDKTTPDNRMEKDKDTEYIGEGNTNNQRKKDEGTKIVDEANNGNHIEEDTGTELVEEAETDNHIEKDKGTAPAGETKTDHHTEEDTGTELVEEAETDNHIEKDKGTAPAEETKTDHHTEEDTGKESIKLINVAEKFRIDLSSYSAQLEIETYINDKCSTDFVTEHNNDTKRKFNMRMPVLLVVLEGDLDTVSLVAKAVTRGLPVLLIKGTGKAADLIANHLNDESTLETMASKLFGLPFTTDPFDELKENMSLIKEKSSLINIFDVEHDEPSKMSMLAGDVIVKAWSLKGVYKCRKIKVKSMEPVSQAVAKNNEEYNCFEQKLPNETARHFTPSKHTSPTSLPLYFYFGFQFLQKSGSFSSESAQNLLLSSLRSNRTDYVHTLLNKGVTLNMDQIASLYKQVACHCVETRHCSHVAGILKRMCKPFGEKLVSGWETSEDLREDVPKLCRDLLRYIESKDICRRCGGCIGHTDVNKKKSEKKSAGNPDNKKESTDQRCGGCFGNTAGNEDESEKKSARNPADNKKESTYQRCGGCFENTAGNEDESEKKSVRDAADNEKENQEIFSYILLWSLLSNKTEIAFIVWQKIENQLVTGLVSTVILKKLQAKAARIKEHKLSREIKASADRFQKLCLSLMDSMYAQYPNLAKELMDDKQTVWGIRTTPLQFAHENLMYDVVAHACAQKNLNIKWYGDYHHDLKYLLKSGICTPKCYIFGKIQTPIAKFLINYVIFAVALISYSAFVLTGIDGVAYERGWNRAWEYFVYLWAFGDSVEETLLFLGICRVRGKSPRGIKKTLKTYFYDFWNFVDVFSYLLLASAIFVRHELKWLYGARLFYSLSLLVMFFRFLEIFLINNTLGCLLIMLKEMLKDLSCFLLIALVLITGVGVYYHANIWPNHAKIFEADFIDWRIWDILYYPYWQMYGEGMNEYLEGRDTSDCTSDHTIWSSDTSAHRCPVKDPSVPVIAAFYVLISNLLLVNLVIAMFSYTFYEVKRNSERLWSYERYNVITDYKEKIPSPFNLEIGAASASEIGAAAASEIGAAAASEIGTASASEIGAAAASEFGAAAASEFGAAAASYPKAIYRECRKYLQTGSPFPQMTCDFRTVLN